MKYKRTNSVYLTLLTVLLTLNSLGIAQQPTSGIKFYENKNQWPDHVLFKTDQDAGNIWLEKGRILYHFMDFSEAQHGHHSHEHEATDLTIQQALVAATFEGANRQAKIETSNPTAHYQNYFKGSNPENWATEVRGYSQVKYIDFYEGVDLVFFEKDNALKYEFHLTPFSNPAQIQIKYEGHDEIRVQEDGSLVVSTEIGEIIENKPFAYQRLNGQLVEVSCLFQLDGNHVTFHLGEYDSGLPLIIDPELVFSTYAGSVSDSHGWTATYGHDGSAYTGGLLFGPDYPTPAPAWNTVPTLTDEGYGISDVFISKYSNDGSDMIWTNFIGGGDNTQGTESIQSLICDSDDNVYLYGTTSSLDFPISGGFQTTHAGGTALNIANVGTDFGTVGSDIYIMQLSADGTELIGSTYVGGSGNDGINYNIYGGSYTTPSSYDSLTSSYSDQFKGEITLDSDDNIVVVSSTWSSDFPVSDGFQMTSGGMQDAIIFKISNDCSALIWGSYFGGTNNDVGNALVIDSTDHIFITGATSSDDLPGTTDGAQEIYNSGVSDGYTAKISDNGETLVQSTYIGTDAYDHSYLLTLDDADQVYLFGVSKGDMPITLGKYNNPGSSGFLWKLTNDLTEIEFTTSIGNGSLEPVWLPTAFSFNQCDRIYLAGWGGTPIIITEPLSSMPTTIGAFQEDAPDGFDFYMMVLDTEAETLEYGSYFGGELSREHADGGTSRFDENGTLYQAVCGGCGGNSDLPTTVGAWSNENPSSNCNSAVYKFDLYVFANASFEEMEDTICVDNGLVSLSALPDGGVFSGTGVSGTNFDPDVAGIGNHTLYYTVTDVEGCRETSDSLIITVVECIDDSGLPKLNASNITLYPNPFSDYTTLNFGQNLTKNHTVTIYDILGQEVYLNEKVTGSTLEIKKAQLGKGVYLLSIRDNNSVVIYNSKLAVE